MNDKIKLEHTTCEKTQEQKIAKINEVIANKELSFGCSVFIQNYTTSITIIGDNRGLCITEGTEYNEFLGQVGTYTQSFQEKHIKSVIGHQVFIGDVLDFIYKKENNNINRIGLFIVQNELCRLWEYKIKPIEEQTELCIDYVYNLVKDV